MPAEQVRLVRVATRRTIAEQVFELELESIDGTRLPDWEPGAHIDLRLGSDLIRQYSLVPSSSGREGTWTIAILVEPEGRGGSVLISETLHPGTEVKTSGPRNHFALSPGGEYWFVAGGIGITPMLAMCAAADSAGARWRLSYLGRDRVAMPYLDELQARYPGRVETHIRSDDRRLDASAAIRAMAQGTGVYVCGPERLLDEIEAAMAPDRLADVHLERFHPRDDVFAPNTDFTVYAAKSDIEFVVPHDETIILAADFEGITVEGDCLEGTCGSCETRVLLGAVEHRDSVLGPLERLAARSMMICVSRAAPGCDRLELDL